MFEFLFPMKILTIRSFLTRFSRYPGLMNEKDILEAISQEHFILSQLVFTCSKSTIDTLEQCVKSVQS